MQKRITDCFTRSNDGRWVCNEAVTFNHSSKQIQFVPGAAFGPEDSFMGLKVAKWLDSLVDTRRATLAE